MSIKKCSKSAIVCLSIVLSTVLAAAVLLFLFIPRKSDLPLLPNTLAALEKYPGIKIDDKYITVPQKGLKGFLERDKEKLGAGNAYDEKYKKLYDRSGLYLSLSYAECVELHLSTSDDLAVTLENWEGLEGFKAYEVFLDANSMPTYTANRKDVTDVSEIPPKE